MVDLPALTTISFHGDCALRGDYRDDRVLIEDNRVKWKNVLKMKSKLKIHLKII